MDSLGDDVAEDQQCCAYRSGSGERNFGLAGKSACDLRSGERDDTNGAGAGGRMRERASRMSKLTCGFGDLPVIVPGSGRLGVVAAKGHFGSV